MPFNGTELINQPFNTTFSPFTDLFSNYFGGGMIFWLIPISIVGVALFVKTRDPVMISVYLLATGSLTATGSIYLGAMDMSLVFTVIAALGLAALFISLFFRR